MKRSSLDVDGTRLEYLEAGKGAPVILLHGAPGDCRMWAPHCEALANDYRAIAYTQRYFGRSLSGEPSTGRSFGVQTHAADLVGFVTSLRAGPAHVIAWSYAGHVALTAALERPQHFKTLFVFEPGVPSYVTSEADRGAAAAEAEQIFAPVFAAVRAGENELAVRLLLDGSGGAAGYFAAQPLEQRRIQLENALVMPRLLLEQTPPPMLSCDQLRGLTVPTAIAWGELTRGFFSIVSQAAARCIGGTAHRAVPGATHLWPLEQPEAFVALTKSFLRLHEPR